MASVWIAFAACAAALAVSGSLLSRYGDIIADKTGLSGGWIGLVLLASVTSLPELVAGIAAVTAADVPNIAVGDVLGSCVFNLAVLVVVDFLHRGESVYRRASQGHVLSAGFGVVLIGIAALSLVLSQSTASPSIAHVGVYSPVILALYLISVRAIYEYEREQLVASAAGTVQRYPDITLRRAMLRYAGAAVVVVVAGAALPFVGARLSHEMGWHGTFVGTIFVAAATSLPELVVTVAALRIGAVDMAIANLLGSNLFNVAILAVDDLFFVRGPLLSHVSREHLASAASAIVMSGIVVVSLLYRPRTRLLRTIGWSSLALLTIYLLNAYALYVLAS